MTIRMNVMSEKRNRVFIIHEDSIDHNDLICALCSLDARELVRCKDCESFWQEEVVEPFTGEKKIAICCGKGNRLKSRNWFCADGKRKDT